MNVMMFCHKCSASVASGKGTVRLKSGRIIFRKTALTHAPSAVSKGFPYPSFYSDLIALYIFLPFFLLPFLTANSNECFEFKFLINIIIIE